MPFDPQTSPLIGLCGGIGCGKTSVAKMLTDDFGFVELSFADKLKQTAIDLFQIPHESCYGTQADKMKPIPHLGHIPPQFSRLSETWSCRVGASWCGRYLLEYFGTEACRMVWAPIWVEAIRKQITVQWAVDDDVDRPRTRFVVADLRFQNEQDMVYDLAGICARVEVEGQEIETTGHASDSWYAEARVEAVMTAPKPGLHVLEKKTNDLMHTLGIHPRVVRIDSGKEFQ